MVHRLVRRSLALAGAALLVSATVVSADNISNNLDASIDVIAEVMPLSVGGPSGTTQLYVDPTNGDGKSGCNLTGSTTLVVNIVNGNPSIATVSPTSVTFTGCGSTPILTVTPVSQGSTTVGLSLASNNTGASFDLSPATFTVNVTPPPNTPPQISIMGVTGGANYEIGNVPTATCQVTDAEDGNSSFPATLSAISGPLAADGLGEQEASCSYTDAGGLLASASVTYNIVDLSAPLIGYILNPASPDGSNGWYKSGVTLTWTVTESESPSSLAKTGCVDQNVSADQAETQYSCSATSAGGSAGPVTVSIKRDGTPPSISGSASPVANTNGWNNSDVTVSFNCTDNPSGVASCESDHVLGEGANQSATGTAFDNAGNTNSATVSGINVDKTPPTVALVGGPADGASYYFGSVPSAPTCSASDALSDLDGACSVSGYGTGVGSHTVMAAATDKAGNSSNASVTYSVLSWTLNGFFQPVDMNDTVNIVKGGSTVPLKFKAFAGPIELTQVGVVDTFTAKPVSCDALTAGTDDIEVTSTGGTSLRYDASGGQFIQNWQTPKAAGVCYRTTMKTDDGSSIVAYFKTK